MKHLRMVAAAVAPATILLSRMAMAFPASFPVPDPGTIGINQYAQPLQAPSIVPPSPDDDLSLGFRERFLAASGNTNRLSKAAALRAGLIDDPTVFAAIDGERRGVITLEDVRRFVRSRHGAVVRP